MVSFLQCKNKSQGFNPNRGEIFSFCTSYVLAHFLVDVFEIILPYLMNDERKGNFSPGLTTQNNDIGLLRIDK